jgi:pilus assembly protein CpaC
MKIRMINYRILLYLAALLTAYGLFFAFPSWGEGPAHIKVETTWPQMLPLTVGKSLTLEISGPVKRIALASPEIADAMVVAPRQVYIIGKAAGTTNLTIWGKDDKVTTVIDLKVTQAPVPDKPLDKEEAFQNLDKEKSPIFSVEIIKGSKVSEMKFEMEEEIR